MSVQGTAVPRINIKCPGGHFAGDYHAYDTDTAIIHFVTSV